MVIARKKPVLTKEIIKKTFITWQKSFSEQSLEQLFFNN